MFISKRAKIQEKVLDNIKIVYVDGRKVREKEIEFVVAGHYYRYPNMIPENEIWVEDVYKDNVDLVSDLIHEFVERAIMKSLKMKYDESHEIANQCEMVIRKNKSISKRAATLERAMNVGVGINVRKYWRAYYKQHNIPNMALMNNAQLNQVIAGDFAKAKPVHRFLLKSAEPGEFRKAGGSGWYYLAAYRNGQYDIIAIAQGIKEPHPDTAKRRMTKDWLDTGWRQLLDIKTRPGK